MEVKLRNGDKPKQLVPCGGIHHLDLWTSDRVCYEKQVCDECDSNYVVDKWYDKEVNFELVEYQANIQTDIVTIILLLIINSYIDVFLMNITWWFKINDKLIGCARAFVYHCTIDVPIDKRMIRLPLYSCTVFNLEVEGCLCVIGFVLISRER